MPEFRAVFVGESPADVDNQIFNYADERRAGVGKPTNGIAEFSWEKAGLDQLLDQLGGKHARKFLPLLAREVTAGRRLHNTPKLQRDFGVKSGIGFAGVIGPMNLMVKNRVGRKLVESQWEGDHASWTMPAEAAHTVLGKWG